MTSNSLPEPAVLLIVGPTASGKTDVSISLARELGAEIVSADARQVYRGLDIGTAKPSVGERKGVPHHFVDELEPDQPFSAGEFSRQAEARIRQIRERGAVPLVVGGSTLYIDALVKGLANIPDVDPSVRELLIRRLENEGADKLFGELKGVDPASAATMDATKSQRIVRALEVYHGTGVPLSDYHAFMVPPSFRYRGVLLRRRRTILYERINRRVDGMIADGLVREVQLLLERGIDPKENALQTIGYREVIAHLSGDIDHDEMVHLIKRNTRRYAKRQITWFNRYEDFIVIDAETEMAELRRRVLGAAQHRPEPG